MSHYSQGLPASTGEACPYCRRRKLAYQDCRKGYCAYTEWPGVEKGAPA